MPRWRRWRRPASIFPSADRPAFLDRLAGVEIQLGDPKGAAIRGASWRPSSRRTSASESYTLHLALAAGDEAEAAKLVAEVRKAEGDQGTMWRFTQAALLIDKVRRGQPEHRTRQRSWPRKSPSGVPNGPAALRSTGSLRSSTVPLIKAITLLRPGS